LQNTVLFLGAGASAPFGYPTTERFKLRLEDELRADSMQNKLLKGILSRNELRDIEEVLSVFDQLLSLEGIPQALDFLTQVWENTTNAQGILLRPRELAPTITGMRDIVRDAIFRYYALDTQQDRLVLEMYRPLLNAIFSLGDAPIIATTNYDMVVERFGHLSGINVNDGFYGDPNTEIGKWIPGFPNFEESLRQGCIITLLKLHGSLNWYLPEPKYFVGGDYRTTIDLYRTPITGSANRSKPSPNATNMLIYPGSKSALDERPNTYPFFGLFQDFKDALKKARSCLIIGYKFRDSAINACLLDFLQSENAGLYVISPHADLDIAQNLKPPPETRDRIRRLNKRFDLQTLSECASFAERVGQVG